MDKCKSEVTTPKDNENKATGWKRQELKTDEAGLFMNVKCQI